MELMVKVRAKVRALTLRARAPEFHRSNNGSGVQRNGTNMKQPPLVRSSIGQARVHQVLLRHSHG